MSWLTVLSNLLVIAVFVGRCDSAVHTLTDAAAERFEASMVPFGPSDQLTAAAAYMMMPRGARLEAVHMQFN
jgi:hypothetical protein